MTVYLYFPKEFHLDTGCPMGPLFVLVDVFKRQVKCVDLALSEPFVSSVKYESWKDTLHLYFALIMFKVILFVFRVIRRIPNKTLTIEKFDCLYNLYVERDSK
jgi:hypothetical protein